MTIETGHPLADYSCFRFVCCYDVERSFRLLVYGAIVPFVNGIILRAGRENYYRDGRAGVT